MFAVEMLPAREGDGLIVEYGERENPHRVLVDCGYRSTYREVMKRLRARPDDAFELFVVTHIDNDHITGAVPFIADDRVTPERVREVWFNGRSQAQGLLGVAAGEYFSKLLLDKGFAWNGAPFGGAAAVVDDEPEPLPVRELPGGLRLTLLSPTRAGLDALARSWNAKLDKLLAGRSAADAFAELPGRLRPDDILGEPTPEKMAALEFEPDDTPANGSSIAFLAEYVDDGEPKAVLLAGDAFAPVLAGSIRRLLGERGLERLAVDALKVSHHGSRKNTSDELLSLLDCRAFLISTDGSKRHAHPNPECISRILLNERTSDPIDLHFNYRSPVNARWDDTQADYDYTAHYPADGTEGLRVEL